MKLHLPKGLRKAVLACLAAVAAAGALSVTVGTAYAAWGTAQKETAGGDGWGLVLEDHFSESTLNDDYWQRIQYESPGSVTNWRGTQSTDEGLVEFRDVGGNSALTLWGRYGTYTNQNNQHNTTTDVYAAGGIYSKNVFSFQYGYVEVRAKYDCAKGVWPAIWMMPQQSTLGNWPRSGEIDIMEHINSEARYYSTLHRATSETSGDKSIGVSVPNLPSDAVTGWHTYGVEWASDHITFFLDGSVTGSIYWTEDGYSLHNAAGAQTSTHTFTGDERAFWPFDAAGHEFYLIIDQQVAGSPGWVGNPNDATQQKLTDEGIAFDIDYVKVWSSDEYNHLQELTWQGEGDTWEEGTAGDVFLSGNSVVFGDTGVKEVKIAGTVHAGNMSVRNAGYTFAGKDGGNVKLEVGGALNMVTGASFACTVELGGNVYCKLTGSGNITYTGTGVFTINTIDASDYSGTIEVTGGGRLLLSTDFETAEGGTIDLQGTGILAFNNNNAAAGGANGDTTVTANLTGVTKLEGKGGFCVTLTGSVQGTGVLTTDKYSGAAFSSTFIFDGDVSGFSDFTTSAGQYNISHYSGTSGHAAYTFNAGLALSGDTTFNVVKNDNTAGHDTWIELSESSVLTGSGSIVKTGEGDLRVYGNTSGYSGSLKLQQGKLLLDGIDGSGIDLSLENATAADNVANLEGTGGVLKSVALGNGATAGSLALGDGAEWELKTVTVTTGQTLTLRSTDGTADVQGLTGTGGTFIVQGGTVNLSGYAGFTGSLSVNSGKLVLGSAPGDSGLTALTLNDGTRVESALTTGTLKFGTLTLPSTAAAGGAVLGLTGVLSDLTLEAAAVTGGTLHIELTDEFISSKVAETGGYELFSGAADVWAGHIEFTNETYGSRLKLQGNLLTLDALTGLLWAGTEGSNTWSTASENQDWKNSDAAAAFTDQSDVLFAEGDGVSKTVQLSGTLAPQNVTVQSGEGWVFGGDGSLAATGKITVGESGKASLTLSGTGAVSSEGIVLVGNGSKLTITAAPSSGTYTFKHIEIGEGSELVLQGAAAANSTKWDCTDSSYAGGAGSIVLEGTGILTSDTGHSGILWAFLTNTEANKPTIGHFKLRKHEDAATTLVLNGEMGSDNDTEGASPVHGLGVIENLWVEDGNTLMVRSRALGKTQTVRTLHLAGDGSNASYDDASNEGTGVTLDAALVLGHNQTADGIADRRSSIFWNITAEADTSISVLASAAGDVYTWKLEETVNTGTYTLTKKGAGTLVLGEGSTLTGSGKVAVADGILQLAGGMSAYTGTMSLSGDAQAQFVGGQSLSLFTGIITLADGKTMAFDADAQLTAGSLTASATGLSFGAGTNFAAGSLTLTGTINVTGGAALSGNGVLKVAESSTLSLDENTYSGMKVELESGSTATDTTTSKLALNGGSFTGDVTTMGRGEITLNANTAGAINVSGDAYLTATDGAAFNGTITLTGSQQKFGIFGASGNVLQKLIASKGDGILVANGGSGGVIEAAEGLSEVWVGGPAGTQVSIGTLKAGGENHSFTTDNGVFQENFTNMEGHWAGNSGRVNVTGEVSGYTSFTTRRKGSAVTDGIDLLFSGTVNMGDQQNITITAEHSHNENGNSTESAVILFDTTSTITGSGTITKQGAGELILAGSMTEKAWAVNVTAGTLTLGKSGQDPALNYSFTGLTMAASTTTTVAGPCNLTITGKLDAAQGTLALNAETTLTLQHKAAANQLGTLALGANGTLKLGMDATGFASLELGTLTNASHQLTLQLEGLDTWIGAQNKASSYELQLFSGNAAGDLVAAIGDRIEGLDGYTYEWDDTGKLTITVSDTDVPMIWSEDGATMTWSSGSNVWGEDHNAAFDGSQDVTFAGTSTAPITVTLGENIDVRGNMTVQKGAGVSDSQSYTFATGDHSLTVGGNLSIADGLDVTFTGTGAVAVSGSLSVGTEGGAASLTLSGTGAVSANDLVLTGDGSSLTITATPTTGTHSFRRVELGANTELVLQNAGSLSLDADSTLTGEGKVSVTGGLLQLAGGMNSYTGTMSLSGDTAQLRFVGGDRLKLFKGTITVADVGTLAFDADAQLTAGSLTASAAGLSFGAGTNFAAGSLTLTGTIAVTGGAALSGNGVLKVAESSTLSLDNNTYSGMKVELESGSAATNDTTSKLALNGGSFTGNVTAVGRGEITLNADTAGAISVSGSAYLNVSGGSAFTGTITLSDSGQKFGIFGATGNQTVLQKLVAATGDGVLVANGGTIETAEGLSEVWVDGETGTQVSIGTLKASGKNHSFTTDNGVFQENFTDMEGHWADNSGRVDVTGEVSGYTSFTARRKGTAVTGGIDLAFSGTVNMGDQQNITITAERSQHENEVSQDDATILFDTSSMITGSGTITKQGAGNLILAGTIAADAWAVNVNAGTLTLGKSGQDAALNYSFTGLTMAASTTTTVAGACNLTLTGKLDAAQGTLALNAKTTLALRHTAAANQLGTLALGADGTLTLGMDATSFASLALGALSNADSYQLTLQLEGLDTWIGAQEEASSYELQLFSGNAAGDLVAAIGDRIEGLGNYTYELDATGLLTITVSDTDVPMIWSESEAAMTWSSTSNVWGEDHNAAFDGSQDVTFAGTSTAPITVTLGENINVRGNMTVQKGAGVSNSQSYTFATRDHSLTVGGNLSITDGLDVTFTGSGAVTANGLVLAGDGSSLTITATPTTGTHSFQRVELGAGTELVLQNAGSLTLDADSTLTGAGSVSVTGGLLQLAGGMSEYTGTMSLSGDTAQLRFVGGEKLKLFTGTITLADVGTLAFDADAQLSAGSLTASAAGLSFGSGTNFAAGSLTLTGTINVTGGAALSGNGVLKVAESSTLSLDENTYSGMKVELESGSAATNDTTSKLALNGGSFTGNVTTKGRGEITLNADTAGAINVSGSAYLNVSSGASFTGTITLSDSGQKFGIFGATGNQTVLRKLEATAGNGILVVNSVVGETPAASPDLGGIVREAVGLSEVWVGGPAGTHVTIGTLTAAGSNHSFTTDNGYFMDHFPDGVQGGDVWAGNSGRVNITGEVSGYTSFTARRKGTAVTGGIDLAFSGTVNMGNQQNVTITADDSAHDNENTTENAVILFDTSSTITGSGTITKQGAGNLILAGAVAADAWAVNVTAGTLTLGKGGQDAVLNYSFKGLSMAASTTTTVAGPCDLTLTGKLDAAQGTLALNAETTLSLRHTAAANQLGTLALGADGTLRLGMDATGFASLALGTLSNVDSHQLTLQLEGLDTWIGAQSKASSYALQLFTGNAAGDLVSAIGDRIEGLGNYTYTLDATGLLTITVSEADVPMIWSEDGATMTWSSVSNVWGENHNAAFDGSRDVTFAGTSTAPITVTLGENINVRGNMTVQKGAGVSDSQSYTFATGDHSLTVGGNLSIANGLDVTFTGTGAVSVSGSLSVGTEGGAASLTLSGTGAVSANGLVLTGDGSSLTITATPSTGTHSFRRVELGANTELVLQDAGALTLDADSTLTGSGDLRVSAGQLRVLGNTADYTGTFRAAGGSLVLDSLDASHATVSIEGAAAGSPDVSLNGTGSLKDIRLGGTAVSGAVRLGAAANWSLASVSLQGGQSLSVQGTDGSALTLGSAEGFATAEGSTLNLNGVSCTITGASQIAGTLGLSDGAVLAAQGGGSIGTLSADGGGLRVESAQSLTVVTSVGAGRGLSELRLGASAELRVQGGSLKIDGAGALSWGSGAAMRLDGAERVTLGDSFTFGESDGTLLFRLSDVFMETFAESGKTKFFLGNLWDSGWANMFSFKPDSAYEYKNLHLDTQGCLAWDPDSGVHWTGGSDDTWTNEGTGEWENVQGSDSPGGSPQDVDVYFKNEDETARDVIVGGDVTPSNVFVESGVFTFTGQGGLNLTKDETDRTGVLVVGGGSADAKLTLDVVNKNLPTVVLDERGTLVLANDAALTKADQGGATDTTLIKFKGGVLEYSGDKKLNDADVSGFVAQTESGSTGAVKVSVDGSGAYGEGVTWGDTQRAISGNGGLTLALDQKGIEKSGTGAFTLAWQESEGAAPHAGAVKVDAGTLSLAVNTANSASVLNGNAVVSEGGRLVLRSTGDGGLTYAGNITGAGALSIREGSVSLSGSNDVKQIELAGGTTRVSGDRALGGADSHLKLQGGTLTSDEAAQVQAGSIEVEKDTVVAGQIGLAGNLSGNGTLKAADESHPVISGDMSLYGGRLDTGASGTWVLSEHALEGEIRTSVSGNGSVQFTGAATFGGEVAGSVTLENTGTGELVVTSEASSADAKLKGNVTLGNAEHHAVWSGSALENGTVTLSNVTLTAGDLLTPDGVRVVVDTTAAARVREVSTYAAQTDGGVVDVRGMRADKLDGITIREDGQLSGVTGTYTVGQDAPLELYFAAGNVSAERDGGRALIVGGEGGFSLDAQNADNLRLHLDAAAGAILDILSQSRAGESKTAYLNLLDGGELRGFDEFLASSDALGILREFVDEVSTDDAGNIVLVGSAMDVYVAPHTATTLSGASTLNEVKATVLAQATDSLSLSYDGASVKDATVHNLLGVQGSQLHLLNSNSSPTADGNRLQITLDNTEVADLDLADYPTVDEPEFGQTTVRGQHTTFDGSIDGGVGVDVTKAGLGTLSVGGNYTLSDGSTTISQGALKLRGQENSMVGLSFAYTSEEQQSEAGEEKRGLLLDGGRTTVVGSITEAGVGKGDIVLSNGAELVLQGVSSLAGTSIIGDASGGTLSLVENESGSAGKLRLSGAPGAVQLSGVGVNLASENTELDLGSGKNDVSFLSGTGTVRSAADGTLGVQGGTFSGTLGMSDGATSAGRLVVLAGASFTLKDATNASGTNRQNAWDVQLAAGANFTVDVSGQPSGNSPLVLGDVLLGCGNMTVNFGDRAIDGFSLEANIFGVGDDGTLTFLSNSSVSNGEDVKTGITVDSALRADFLSHVRFTGAGNLMKDREARIDEEGNLLVSTKDAEVNKFLLAMPNAGKNARAGAEMMWDSLRGMSQWDAFLNSMLNPTSDFERLCYNLLAMHDSGDAAGLERTFTAVAGASVSVVAPALAEDMHRQLSAIRNRTTTMAGEVDSHTDLPLCHAWINAESGYHKVDADGYLPGYTLDNWGGTLGFDADVSPHATVGLAITAMYGDLKPDSADSATGDLDSSYLSAFARLSHGPWIHTLVVSSGVADVKLDRTVNYGSGNYRTHGDTTGYSIGALYEVGYTCIANDSFALQPIANVEVRYASLRGYSETGSDVGLNVDDSDQTVLTFGAGARAQIAVHENAFNRSSILEARLLFKADVGDRSGTSRNAIIGGTPAETECAEVGAVGLEAGLGLSIPIGSRSGSVFIDGSFELREHWTSANATLGYRLSF